MCVMVQKIIFKKIKKNLIINFQKLKNKNFFKNNEKNWIFFKK